MSKHKSGFVAIIGRPNVGKSTLLNRILGQKVAIVSDKSQTTRNTIKGILSTEDYQIVFMDTPGIHKSKTKLGEYMMKEQRLATVDAEAILALLDASDYFGPTDRQMLQSLEDCENPVFVVINKTDAAEKEQIDALKSEIAQFSNIYKVVEVSAISGQGIDKLLNEILAVLPEGPKYFPEDQISDYPQKFLAAEVIREKALLLLREEVPHGVGVLVQQMKQRANGNLYIQADIVCERATHKGIIIGKNGSMLKEIGTLARTELEELLDAPVFLEIFVKIEEDWRNKSRFLKELGYDAN